VIGLRRRLRALLGAAAGPPRVVHVVPALFGPGGVVGGAERYALELARHMAQVVPTRLVTFGERPRRERVGELDVRVVGPASHVRGQRTNPISARLIPELRWATVVHCHQQHVVMSTVSALWARLTGRRVYVSDLGGGGWDLSAYVSTDRLFHGHLHISEYSRRVFGHAGAPFAHVILGGVDTERFSPAPEAPRTGRRVLFVGRLLPHKGVDDLIDAVPDGATLTVAGPRHDPAYAHELATRAQGKQVEFEHDLDDAGIVAAYRRADCVVLPSVYRTRTGHVTPVPELLGQTLLEGMSCGLPAVCTDVASMPEVVVDGVTGFVVPPNDPARLRERLQWLMNHPVEARAMGAAGRARALERFTWPAVVRRCLELYRVPD
jgi:glycosyltransferase involved in cell wall biosynthesis